jgi:hypothetical protein
LTYLTIYFKIDNGPIYYFYWNGNITGGASANVTLPVVNFTAGSHTFTAYTSSPNGYTDTDSKNDAATSEFNFTLSATCNLNAFEPNNTTATAIFTPLNIPISAAISTATDKDYYKFTTTNVDTKVKVTLTNLPYDYDMVLYRLSNNGSSLIRLGSGLNSGTTNETVTYNAGTTAQTYILYVYGYGGAFSTSQCYNLNIQTSSTNLEVNDRPAARRPKQPEFVNDFDIFPNPANDLVNLHIAVENAGDYTLALTDMLGKAHTTEQVNLSIGENFQTLKVADLPRGIYILSITNGKESWAKKFLKD